MRKRALETLLLLGSLGTVACGPPTSPPPTLPSSAPLVFKIENLEQVNLANNLTVPGYAPASGVQGNWGVFTVSSIQNGVVLVPNVEIGGGGTTFFADDGPGGTAGQISGIFYGIQTTTPTTSTGGTIDFFWHDANATYIASNCVSGANCAPDAAAVGLFASGTLLVRLKLASGIDPASASTFTITNVPMTSFNAPGPVGQSASFADVDTSTAGPWAAALDGDFFTTTAGKRDIRLTTVFTNVASWSGNPAGTIGLRSNDPFRVFTR